MKNNILIGIDAGTSVIKAVAFSTSGAQLAVASVPNNYVTLPDGGVEQDMVGTWACTASTLQDLCNQLPNLATRVIAERSGYTMAFPVPGMLAQIQSNMASALNIDWLLDVALDVLRAEGIDRTRGHLLRDMDDRVLDGAAARSMYHPYISQAGERGPFMEPAARAMFTGLETGVGYFSMMRSVFEGMGYAARDCYAAMGDIPREVRVTGGAARSKAMRVILASILNADIRSVSREEAGASGAAMIGAVQQKIYPDMQSCADVWVEPKLGGTTKPEAGLVELYDQSFAVYQQTRKAMRPAWQALRVIRLGADHGA